VSIFETTAPVVSVTTSSGVASAVSGTKTSTWPARFAWGSETRERSTATAWIGTTLGAGGGVADVVVLRGVVFGGPTFGPALHPSKA
jgi:hypothetical protein